MNNTIRLSVCMVVRDEQDFLTGALQNCLPYLPQNSEFVLIDGSPNLTATRELRDFMLSHNVLTKIVYVPLPQDWPKREWVDEAKYRNEAWSFCRGDWILSIDADEAYDKDFYSALPTLISNSVKKAYYLPTINFIGSTKQIIHPGEFPDFHIRLCNKNFFQWVGKIHSSLWLMGSQPVTPSHPLAEAVRFPLYHYARVKGNIKREYGEIPDKLIFYDGPNPRKEFD